MSITQMPHLMDRGSAKQLMDEGRLDEIIINYKNWVGYPLYLIFKGENRYDFNAPLRYKAALASKRGNKVHRLRINKSLEAINTVDDVEFYDWSDISHEHKTKAVFVSLTFKRDFIASYAWENVGKYWAKYADFVQHHYHGVEFLRVWESHADGFPHIHCLMLFKEHEFVVRPDANYEDGELKIRWLMKDGDDFSNLSWDSGICRVYGVGSIKGGFGYLNKYLMKSTDISELSNQKENLKKDLTLTMCWVFRKRSFGLSKRMYSLIKHLHYLDRLKIKKPVTLGAEMTERGIYAQGFKEFMLIARETVFKWSLVGFYGGDLEFWSKELSISEYLKLRASDTFKFKPEKDLSTNYKSMIDMI